MVWFKQLIRHDIWDYDMPVHPILVDVRVNGRPLTTGAVVFMPLAERDYTWASAPIARDGSFAIDPQWQRPDTGPVPYKIFLVPDPRRNPTRPPERGGQRVVPVSLSLGAPAFSEEDGEFGVPQRFRAPSSTNLEVDLGPEPARIDLDLRD